MPTLFGLDVHAASTTFAVIGQSGRRLGTHVVETNGQALVHQDYRRLTAAGTKPNLAKLTIARKIAAITLSMWKSKEKYDPTKHRKPSS